MYFFLSTEYREPSRLLRDPEVIREELAALSEALLLGKERVKRLTIAKEELEEAERAAPEAPFEELLSRLERAERDYLSADEACLARTEELAEVLYTLGAPEGRCQI